MIWLSNMYLSIIVALIAMQGCAGSKALGIHEGAKKQQHISKNKSHFTGHDTVHNSLPIYGSTKQGQYHGDKKPSATNANYIGDDMEGDRFESFNGDNKIENQVRKKTSTNDEDNDFGGLVEYQGFPNEAQQETAQQGKNEHETVQQETPSNLSTKRNEKGYPALRTMKDAIALDDTLIDNELKALDKEDLKIGLVKQSRLAVSSLPTGTNGNKTPLSSVSLSRDRMTSPLSSRGQLTSSSSQLSETDIDMDRLTKELLQINVDGNGKIRFDSDPIVAKKDKYRARESLGINTTAVKSRTFVNSTSTGNELFSEIMPTKSGAMTINNKTVVGNVDLDGSLASKSTAVDVEQSQEKETQWLQGNTQNSSLEDSAIVNSIIKSVSSKVSPIEGQHTDRNSDLAPIFFARENKLVHQKSDNSSDVASLSMSKKTQFYKVSPIEEHRADRKANLAPIFFARENNRVVSPSKKTQFMSKPKQLNAMQNELLREMFKSRSGLLSTKKNSSAGKRKIIMSSETLDKFQSLKKKKRKRKRFFINRKAKRSDNEGFAGAISYTDEDGHELTYTLGLHRLTYDNARRKCRDSNYGDLVTIDNEKEQDFIVNNVITEPNDYWIGLDDRDREGTFQWIDNSPLFYTHWGNMEPDDGTNKRRGSLSYHNEDCTLIKDTSEWNDVSCNDRNMFICKKPNIKPGGQDVQWRPVYADSMVKSNQNIPFEDFTEKSTPCVATGSDTTTKSQICTHPLGTTTHSANSEVSMVTPGGNGGSSTVHAATNDIDETLTTGKALVRVPGPSSHSTEIVEDRNYAEQHSDPDQSPLTSSSGLNGVHSLQPAFTHQPPFGETNIKNDKDERAVNTLNAAVQEIEQQKKNSGQMNNINRMVDNLKNQYKATNESSSKILSDDRHEFGRDSPIVALTNTEDEPGDVRKKILSFINNQIQQQPQKLNKPFSLVLNKAISTSLEEERAIQLLASQVQQQYEASAKPFDYFQPKKPSINRNSYDNKSTQLEKSAVVGNNNNNNNDSPIQLEKQIPSATQDSIDKAIPPVTSVTTKESSIHFQPNPKTVNTICKHSCQMSEIDGCMESCRGAVVAMNPVEFLNTLQSLNGANRQLDKPNSQNVKESKKQILQSSTKADESVLESFKESRNLGDRKGEILKESVSTNVAREQKVDDDSNQNLLGKTNKSDDDDTRKVNVFRYHHLKNLDGDGNGDDGLVETLRKSTEQNGSNKRRRKHHTKKNHQRLFDDEDKDNNNKDNIDHENDSNQSKDYTKPFYRQGSADNFENTNDREGTVLTFVRDSSHRHHIDEGVNKHSNTEYSEEKNSVQEHTDDHKEHSNQEIMLKPDDKQLKHNTDDKTERSDSDHQHQNEDETTSVAGGQERFSHPRLSIHFQSESHDEFPQNAVEKHLTSEAFQSRFIDHDYESESKHLGMDVLGSIGDIKSNHPHYKNTKPTIKQFKDKLFVGGGGGGSVGDESDMHSTEAELGADPSSFLNENHHQQLSSLTEESSIKTDRQIDEDSHSHHQYGESRHNIKESSEIDNSNTRNIADFPQSNHFSPEAPVVELLLGKIEEKKEDVNSGEPSSVRSSWKRKGKLITSKNRFLDQETDVLSSELKHRRLEKHLSGMDGQGDILSDNEKLRDNDKLLKNVLRKQQLKDALNSEKNNKLPRAEGDQVRRQVHQQRNDRFDTEILGFKEREKIAKAKDLVIAFKVLRKQLKDTYHSLNDH